MPPPAPEPRQRELCFSNSHTHPSQGVANALAPLTACCSMALCLWQPGAGKLSTLGCRADPVLGKSLSGTSAALLVPPPLVPRTQPRFLMAAAWLRLIHFTVYAGKPPRPSSSPVEWYH